jgi:AraC family transcriptional regulator of adaptative response/methylated-DNA-[protein]-cysteine methyltransferase
MSALKNQSSVTKHFASDEERWQALAGRDKGADGAFVYAVVSTGVYCRPSCAARRPNRENVRFYRTVSEADRAGFRACKRCQPNAASSEEHRAAAILKACKLIENFDDPPDVKELAEATGMSPSHFHRVFKSLTGVTPKKYATAHRSKRLRNELSTSTTVTEAIYGAGFNSNGRFYETSNRILGMTPTALRTGGKGTVIRFAVGECSLGSILVAVSAVGVCSIALGDDPDALVRDLQDRFAKAELIGGDEEFDRFISKVVGLIENPSIGLDLPLDVRGTVFQHRVWEMLRQVPCGQTTTYSQIARRLGQPKATRAVAQACAANKIAVAIPCHRVLRTDGTLSGYRWGIERKRALLDREDSRLSSGGASDTHG